jgi:phospholipid/cholesterol/gamma-HCH transport system substrate-binding protein
MNQILEKIKSNTFPFIVAVTVLVGSSAAWYLLHPASPYHERYVFVVRYESIGTLSPGNRVGVQGITRGQILKVELTDDAVYVTAEVLASTKIPKNSEFRLIMSGLMGEREMSVISGDSHEYIADGDTVRGIFDNGTSDISKDLFAALNSLEEIKNKMTAFRDSLVEGSAGKRIDRIVKKGKNVMNATQAVADDSEAEINQAIERGKAALERAKALAESIPDQTNATLAKAEKSVEKVDSLTASLERLKNEMDAISSKLDHQDNTVGLIASGKGRVNDEIDALVKDTDALIADIKKRGLRLNVDIF